MIVVILASLVATVSTGMFLWSKRHLIKLGFTMPHKGWIPFVGGVVYIKGLDGLCDFILDYSEINFMILKRMHVLYNFQE